MSPKATKESRLERWRERLGVVLLWGRRAAIAALIGLCIWGSLEIRSRVRSDPRFDLSGRALITGELPAWLPEEVRAEIEDLQLEGGDGEALTIFTDRVLARIRERILACSAIRDVSRIRLRTPGIGSPVHGANLLADPDPSGAVETGGAIDPAGGSIDLVLELRVPIAAVAAGGSCYLTDRDGVRFGPPVSAGRVKELGLPLIAGGESGRPRPAPPPGIAWEDRDVREGLDVARTLYDEEIAAKYPEALIERIDISNVGDRARPGECEIFLHAGRLRLGWGRSFLSAGARTLLPRKIIENLEQILARPERYDHCEPLLYTNPMVGRPLARE